MKLYVLVAMFKSFAISSYAISSYCVLHNQIKAWLDVKATDPKNRLGTSGACTLGPGSKLHTHSD
jgi:hypothetical protein